MNMNNPQEILQISEKDFRKEYENALLIEIDAKFNAIQTTTRKPDLGLPLLTGYELTAIKKKLQALQLILNDIKTKKIEEEKEQIKKQDGEYSQQSAKRHVDVDKDVRICTEPITTTMRILGTREISFDALHLITPTETVLSIPCQSGKNRKFDLATIPARYWHMMEEHKMAPLYFTIESGGMLDKKGNAVPIWSNQKDYGATIGQKQIDPTVLMIMVV
jgi:hypothetical protein